MAFVAEPENRTLPSGLREQKKLAARAAIMDAALELFAERGFDETKVVDIAARAGFSPATVARYFPSKESLLFAERDQRLSLLRQAIVDRPPGEAPFEAVVGALHRQPWVAGVSRERLLRTRMAILRSPVLRGQAAVLMEGWRIAISEALEVRGIPAADAGVVAVVVTALLDEASDRWALGGGSADLVELTDEAFTSLPRIFGGPS